MMTIRPSHHRGLSNTFRMHLFSKDVAVRALRERVTEMSSEKARLDDVVLAGLRKHDLSPEKALPRLDALENQRYGGPSIAPELDALVKARSISRSLEALLDDFSTTLEFATHPDCLRTGLAVGPTNPNEMAFTGDECTLVFRPFDGAEFAKEIFRDELAPTAAMGVGTALGGLRHHDRYEEPAALSVADALRGD